MRLTYPLHRCTLRTKVRPEALRNLQLSALDTHADDTIFSAHNDNAHSASGIKILDLLLVDDLLVADDLSVLTVFTRLQDLRVW